MWRIFSWHTWACHACQCSQSSFQQTPQLHNSRVINVRHGALLITNQTRLEQAGGPSPSPPLTMLFQAQLASLPFLLHGLMRRQPFSPWGQVAYAYQSKMLSEWIEDQYCSKCQQRSTFLISGIQKKWILGSMSFTHNNGRSRIIMVVHASFTQFHGVSRTTFFGRQTTSFFGYVTDICKNTWNHVKLREPAWNCVKLRETPWNPRETPWIFVSICHPLHQTHFFLLFMQVPVFYGLHRSVCICAPATRWDGGLANG